MLSLKTAALLALAGSALGLPSGLSLVSYSGSTLYGISSNSYIASSSAVIEKLPTATTTITGASGASLASSLRSYFSAEASITGAPVATPTSIQATFTSTGSGSSGGQLMVNTPASLIECQPAALSFSGGTAPYFLSIIPGGQSAAAPLVQFPQQSAAGVYTWVVNLPSGTSITIRIADSTGVVNYSSPVTILAGTSSSCLNS